MGILGGLVRAGVKSHLGLKRGKIEGQLERERRELEALEREERREARERDALMDALQIDAAERARRDYESPQAKDARELKEYEARRKVDRRYPTPARPDQPSATERERAAMLRYRDSLIKGGMSEEKANEAARRKYMRDRPTTDMFSVLFEEYARNRPGPDTTRRP